MLKKKHDTDSGLNRLWYSTIRDIQYVTDYCIVFRVHYRQNDGSRALERVIRQGSHGLTTADMVEQGPQVRSTGATK